MVCPLIWLNNWPAHGNSNKSEHSLRVTYSKQLQKEMRPEGCHISAVFRTEFIITDYFITFFDSVGWVVRHSQNHCGGFVDFSFLNELIFIFAVMPQWKVKKKQVRGLAWDAVKEHVKAVMVMCYRTIVCELSMIHKLFISFSEPNVLQFRCFPCLSPLLDRSHWYIAVICFPWLEEPVYEECPHQNSLHHQPQLSLLQSESEKARSGSVLAFPGNCKDEEEMDADRNLFSRGR